MLQSVCFDEDDVDRGVSIGFPSEDPHNQIIVREAPASTRKELRPVFDLFENGSLNLDEFPALSFRAGGRKQLPQLRVDAFFQVAKYAHLAASVGASLKSP